jgi:hypothetical protein
MSKLDAIRKKLWTPKDRDDVPPLGTREILAHWLLDEDHEGGALKGGSLIELVGYGKLLEVLPDKIVSNLEKSRLSRDGLIPMLKCGLGYEELLSSVIVDGTPVASSSTENLLFPDLLLPANYLQPGGIPGRTLRWRASGRVTTLSTAGTLQFAIGHASTAVTTISGAATCWAKTGAVVMDAAVHTNEQWFCEGTTVVRSVGAAGTVFAQGESTIAAAAFTVANNALLFMGSAGSAAPAAITMDMTIAEFIALTAKWSLTTAYSITGHIYLLEALN